MKILQVPSGQTEDSFLSSTYENIKRQYDLYKSILDDIDCFDLEFRTKIIVVENKLLEMIADLEKEKNK